MRQPHNSTEQTSTRQNALRRQLLSKITFPQITNNKPKPHHPGRRFTLKTPNLFTPTLYLGQQKFQKTPLTRSHKLFVSLNTAAGPAVRPCRYNSKTKTVTFDLPKNARSGPAVLFLPAREYTNSKTKPAARCPGSVTKNAGAENLMTGRSLREFTFPAGVFYVQVACDLCRTNSLCSNGAIRFDRRGRCYVDQAVCQGQRRWNFTEGLEERTCWSCFSPGCVGAVSDLCPQGLLEKTLNMDPHCCGCCPSGVRVIPGQTLKSLCAQGAIGGGLKPRYEINEHGQGVFDYNCPEQSPSGPYEPVHYIVDQDKCTGCMTCYLNITCAQPRMKARIRHRAALFTLEDIVLEPFRLPELGKYRDSLFLGIWGERDGEPYFREVKLKFGRQWRLGLGLKLAGGPEVSFMIYQKGVKGFKLPLGRGVRPAMQTAGLKDLPEGRFKVRIGTEIGDFALGLGIQK